MKMIEVGDVYGRVQVTGVDMSDPMTIVLTVRTLKPGWFHLPDLEMAHLVTPGSVAALCGRRTYGLLCEPPLYGWEFTPAGAPRCGRCASMGQRDGWLL